MKLQRENDNIYEIWNIYVIENGILNALNFQNMIN